ncbi:hypothetical protein PG996_005770 [Apiospora saccharicola]|uniref:Uncharacterized protein n=1 Tax=Apiospora saccharicola TaxID=335842 RepID=A0ABR1VMH4_9PEZI
MPAPMEPTQQAPMDASPADGVVSQQPSAEPQPDMNLRGGEEAGCELCYLFMEYEMPRAIHDDYCLPSLTVKPASASTAFSRQYATPLSMATQQQTMAATKKVQFGRDHCIKTTARSSSPTIGRAVPLTPFCYSKPFNSVNNISSNNNNNNKVTTDSSGSKRGGLFLAKIEYYNHDPRQRDFCSLEAIDLSGIATSSLSPTTPMTPPSSAGGTGTGASPPSDIVAAIEAHQRGRIERLYPDAPSGGFTVGRARVYWNLSVVHPEVPGPELTQLPRDEVWEQLELMKNRGYVDCIHIRLDVGRRSKELMRYVVTPVSTCSSSSSPSWQV